jgi:exopolyphosphatase/guanosine-5'-triphosphate,3'-diphosphate pyrophosphatase
VRAVGTSAMREAVNRDSLIKRLREESGIKLEVIQGIEEAQLIAEAVLSKVDVRGKLALLIDIGGGSIEISLVDNGDLILSDSVKMGSVRLLQILEERGRSAKVFHRLVKDYANGLRRQLKRELGARKVVVCVGTGGNLEALADLKRTILRKDNTTSISRSELDQISETLQALTFKERVEKLGLRDDRADVIIPAAIVLQSILKYAEVEELRIPRVSLKDGLLLQLIRSTKPRSPEAYRRQVMAFARELGRRFNLEEPHAVKATAIALSLFDQTKRIHKLDDEHRTLLEIAAYLHDIGYAININDHHKHGAYILRSSPFIGVTDREKLVISAVVRYHRKGEPKPNHPEISELDKNERVIVAKLASILRLAEALDKGHSGALRSVTLDGQGADLKMILRGDGELLLERWAVAKRKDFFEDVFNVKVSISE